MNKKFLIIFVVVVAVILVAASGGYYISKEKKAKEGEKEGAKKELQDVGIGVDFNIGVDVGDIGKATENPLKNMPSTNPLEEVANPFRDSYKNPFK